MEISICYLRRSTIDYDVRLHKYIDACKATGTPYIAITWDRLLNSTPIDNELQLKQYAPYGNGVKNIIGLMKWIWFSYKNLFRRRHEYNIIHACNLETFILAYPFRLFGKKIVFDIYDSVNEKIEHFVAPKADLLILPHIERLKQINLTKDKVRDCLVIENVPSLEFEPAANNKSQTSIKHTDNKVHLSYVGVLEQNVRGIENLLEVVKDNDSLTLDIAGVGGGLEPAITEYSRHCDRITYYGKVNYSKALEIMGKSDLIIALYYKLNPAHKYASPNKFYESLFLGVPILTSTRTLVGQQVENINSGYTIDDSTEAIRQFFEAFDHQGYDKKVANCKKIWAKQYQNYHTDIFCNAYIAKLKNLYLER